MTENKKQDSNTNISSNIVTILSGIIGIGAVFYGVGLIVLTAQLYRAYFPDFRIALYAASLVPERIVLGQAAFGFANLTVLILAIFCSVLSIAVVLFFEKKQINIHKVMDWIRTMLMTVAVNKSKMRPFVERFTVIILAATSLLVLVVIIDTFRDAGLVAVVQIAQVATLGIALSYKSVPFIQRTFMVIIISYFSSLSILLYDTPPTIPVQVTMIDSLTVMEGELLADSGNYLHIIIEQDRENREFQLISIPSSQIGRITISTNIITYAHPSVSPTDLPSTPTTSP